MEGHEWTLALGGQNVASSMFIDAAVSGTGTGSAAEFEDCIFGITSLPPMQAYNCSFSATTSGGFTMSTAGAYRFIDCQSGVPGSSAPVFTKTAGQAITAEWRRWSGGITFAGLEVGDTLTVGGEMGTIDLGSPAGAVSVQVRGTYKAITNAGSASVNVDGAILCTDVATILADTGELQTDWADGGRLDLIQDIIAADVVNIDGAAMRGTDSAALAATALSTATWTAPPTGFLAATFPTTVASTTNITAGTITTVTTLTGHTAQTGDTFALANGPTGFAAIDTVVDAILVDTAVIGAAGVGLTAVALADATSDAVIADAIWNAATVTYGTAGTYGEHVESLSAGGDATEAKQDTIIASLALIPQSGGTTSWNSTALDAMADAVWDELLAGHVTVDSAGLVLNEWQDGGRLDLILDAASAPSAAAVATAVWQDTTAGDFTTVGSIGKSLFTAGVVPGAAGGLFIAGSNAATTFATLDVTGATTLAAVSATTVTTSGATTLASMSVTGQLDAGSLLVDTTTTLTGAVASGDITANIIGDITGNLSGSVGSVTTETTLDALVVTVGVAGVGLTDLGGMSTGMKAEVNAEVVDTLATDTYAEPGQGTPAATASLSAKLGYLYKAWRNRANQTATTYQLFNDDAVTVDHKLTVSDDGATAEKGEMITGP